MRLHNRIGLSTELAEAVLNLDEARAEALKEQGADIKARVLGPLISSIPLNELGRDRMCSIAGPFSDEVSVTVLGQIIHDIYTDKSNLTLKIRCALLALDLGADIKADAICRWNFDSLLAAVARELPRPEFAKFLQKPGISDIARNMGECQTGERLLQLYLGQDDSGDASRSVIDNALYLISVVGLRLGPHEIREIMRKRARRLKWDNAPVADYAEADLRVSHKVGLALTAFEWPKEYAWNKGFYPPTEEERIRRALNLVDDADECHFPNAAGLLRLHFVEKLGRPFMVAHREYFGYKTLQHAGELLQRADRTAPTVLQRVNAWLPRFGLGGWRLSRGLPPRMFR